MAQASALTKKEVVTLLSRVNQPMDARLVALLGEREAELAALLRERGVGLALAGDSPALRRFLVARQLDVGATFEMIEAHCQWRDANLPVTLTRAIVDELRKGKGYRRGVDVQGRPLFVIRSGRFDPKVRDLETATRANVYVIQEALATLPPEGEGANQFSLFYDRTGFSFRENWDLEALKVSLACVRGEQAVGIVRRGCADCAGETLAHGKWAG